ncbi:MAG: ribonuclease J [Candidatus Puniceispirillales bacterium]
MHWKKSDLLFLPVGGSEEIGMNANLYHYEDKWILIDLGISFPDETDLGIDVLLPDFEFIKSLGDKFLGIFLTHGHEDHIGAIPYFADDINCPIWGTSFTMALLKRKLKENNKEKKLELNTLTIDKQLIIGPFQIKAIQTSHSIPDPVSILISTKQGDIFHSGDWKLENSINLNEKTNIDNFRSIGENGILAMVCDSTNALVDGKTPSENFAYDGLLDTIKNCNGTALVTCFSSNISRIKSLLDIALKTDRSVLVVGRALLRAIDAAKEVGYLKNIPELLSLKDFNLIPRSNVLIISTGSQGEPNSALSRISKDNDKFIKLIKGDTIIFSSRKIPGNENAILKVQNRFLERGINIVTDDDKNVHVSGHPSRDELIEMYSYIKPKISIPVHGTREHIEAHSDLANNCQVPLVIKPKNGEVIKLNGNAPNIVSRFDFVTHVYDAGEIIPINNERFITRRHSLWNGFVTISIVIDKDGYLVITPQISQIGVSDNSIVDNVLIDISLKIEDFIENLSCVPEILDEELISQISKLVRREFKSTFSKRPIVKVHINRV